MFTEDLQILFQAMVALTLGGLVGWEREASEKWAGLRTHMLVCFATMMLVRLAIIITIWSQTYVAHPLIQADPVRIMEAVIAGIAFLGAGTVFRDPDKPRMRGLTTAASLLAIAPIGVAVALERYVLAIGSTAIVLFTLRVMNIVEHRLLRD